MSHVQRYRRPAVAVLAGACVVGTVLIPASAAQAKDGRVVARKACGPIATTLKLSPEDGRLQAEFELDQNRNGRAWSLVARHNGRQVAAAVRVTRAPSGALGWRLVMRDLPGRDTVTVVARRGTTVCTLSARI